MTERGWSIIVHGGARTISEHRQQANRSGCGAAVAAAADALAGGASALNAAELAVRLLEDDPTFNAGTGAVSTRTGEVELDAAMMDGSSLAVGAVAAIRDIRNPVMVARLLLEADPVLLVGDGARAFALEHGIESGTPMGVRLMPDPTDPSHDTVGCVAIDGEGRVAVATSTGGLTGQMPGRVGDAPIPGCGFYADDHAGGVAISGDGESIMRVLLAGRVVEQLYRHPAQTAVVSALPALQRVGGEAGIIAIDRSGRFGVTHNSDHFAVAAINSRMPRPIAGVHRDEFEDLING
ncbi:asparaginase [Sphingomonas panacisoli]|uniref:Isoaspartyl peptidase n=1 Tax=Sphingomonas panacisoli TaxID=1813879 RepID=A0A5B8LFD0_9SPHN|nr:isoaspartyl peptidase/L-asparaginase family protein [Sphingomonas panacisoli]QDZ06791.1 asparaginase [Sphingomonas panacisoli]